jgi:(R,R)-butanediol dehydrogenase/meso-butanediol dehydrogenase/diacetyl reductase
VAALEALLGLVSPGAKIALVGIFHGPLNLDANRLVEREVTLTGCHAFADEMPEAVRRAAEWAPQLARLIGACVALEDLPAHYKTLLRGEAPGLKSIVTP